MIVEILRIVLGTLFALFIPGFIIVKTFFEEFNIPEQIGFSIVFSIMIDIAIAIFLGYNESWAKVTGGLTFLNIVKAEIVVFFLLLIIYGIKVFIIKRFSDKK